MPHIERQSPPITSKRQTPILTLYDARSTLEEKTISPFSVRIRMLLNYKKLRYRSEWIDYSEIEDLCKALDVKPTSKKVDGSPRYTIPFMKVEYYQHDPNSPESKTIFISDSPNIAEFVDNIQLEVDDHTFSGSVEDNLKNSNHLVHAVNGSPYQHHHKSAAKPDSTGNNLLFGPGLNSAPQAQAQTQTHVRLLPPYLKVYTTTFRSYLLQSLFLPLIRCILPDFLSNLSPDQSAWVTSTRKEMIGVHVSDMVPKDGGEMEEAWAVVESAFDQLAEMLDDAQPSLPSSSSEEGDETSDTHNHDISVSNNGNRNGCETIVERPTPNSNPNPKSTNFQIIKNQITYSDMELASILFFVKRISPTNGWKRLRDRNDGRWARMLEFYDEWLPGKSD